MKIILSTDLKIILKDINLSFEKGELIMILGEVGSGKSSLLQALLNNMLIMDENKSNKTKISINGSISYVAQTAWIQNDTLRNNILFYKEYDQVKYEKTLQ